MSLGPGSSRWGCLPGWLAAIYIYIYIYMYPCPGSSRWGCLPGWLAAWLAVCLTSRPSSPNSPPSSPSKTNKYKYGERERDICFFSWPWGLSMELPG